MLNELGRFAVYIHEFPEGKGDHFANLLADYTSKYAPEVYQAVISRQYQAVSKFCNSEVKTSIHKQIENRREIFLKTTKTA